MYIYIYICLFIYLFYFYLLLFYFYFYFFQKRNFLMDYKEQNEWIQYLNPRFWFTIISSVEVIRNKMVFSV